MFVSVVIQNLTLSRRATRRVSERFILETLSVKSGLVVNLESSPIVRIVGRLRYLVEEENKVEYE